MRPEKLAFVLLTVIVMAEGVKTSNIGYPCSPASTSPKVQADSNTDVSPSITEDDETTSRLTPINGDTPPSSSQEAQSDSTTDVPPSTSETIENAPRLTPINGDTPPSSSQEAQSDSTTDVPPSTSETIENAPRLTPINGATPPSSSQEAQSDSTTDVPPSTSETIENAPRLTPINGDTPPSSSQEAQSDSTTDVPPSTSETIENAPRLTPINGDTPPSSSQEAQSDSTTDVPPSTSETIENAPRCNFLIVAGKNYDMAKIACGEIGGKMFGYEHVQSNETAEETFSDLMSSQVNSSSCRFVWVDIIRKDDNQFQWSDGPNFGLQDSWWNTKQPIEDGGSEGCVASHRGGKLNDVSCSYPRCTMCMDAWCQSP